jgi:hypothetical protein
MPRRNNSESQDLRDTARVIMKRSPSIDRWNIIWLRERIPSERSQKNDYHNQIGSYVHFNFPAILKLGSSIMEEQSPEDN